MPELPEVETIKLGLQKYLVGHKILDVDVRLPRIFSGNPKNIVAAKVIDVRRFGKGLVIDLDNKHSIAVHVKMTGQLVYQSPTKKTNPHPVKVGKLPGKFTHIIFDLDKGSKLFYNDMRQFGWVKILLTKDVMELSFFKELGPEFFKDLTLKKFEAILSKFKTPIKNLLMDQKIVSGIGNIYANDGLFVAKIHPKRQSSSLSEKEVKTLFVAIEKVLKKGLEAGGASEWHYVNAYGETGSYQNFFQVYGMKGKKCKNCGSIIEKITLGGRGTFFCSLCQI